MNVDNIRQRFFSLLPASVYQTEADMKTLEHWLDKLDSTIGTVYHAAVKAGYDEGRAEAWVRQAPSTCLSSQLTIDQLEELASVKVNNEQLRRNVAALKALLDEHRIPYTLQEANEDGCPMLAPVCTIRKPEEIVDALLDDLDGRLELDVRPAGRGWTFRGDAILKDGATVRRYEELREAWINIVRGNDNGNG